MGFHVPWLLSICFVMYLLLFLFTINGYYLFTCYIFILVLVNQKKKVAGGREIGFKTCKWGSYGDSFWIKHI